jgi:hypothetical protein
VLEDKFYLSTNQSTVFHVSNVLRISDLAFLVKFLIGHNTIELQIVIRHRNLDLCINVLKIRPIHILFTYQLPPHWTILIQIRALLGLVNYYHKFLPNLATEIRPLNELLEKDRKWVWNERVYLCNLATVVTGIPLFGLNIEVNGWWSVT